MQSKKCQMKVVENNYEKTNAIKINDYEELKEIIKSDETRFCVINQQQEYYFLQAIWLKQFQHDGIESLQSRLQGCDLPSKKLKAIKLVSDPSLPSELISFSYFDDNFNLCSFTLEVLTSCPSIWFASVVTNKAVAVSIEEDPKQIIIFMPEFSASFTEQSPQLTWFNNQIENEMKIDEAHQFKIGLLSDYLGYVLNNHFIKYSLANLFDENGIVNLKNFKKIKDSIHSQASMFAFSDEKLQEISHLCELSKMLAFQKKLKITSGSSKYLDPQIDSIKQGMAIYSSESYIEIENNSHIKRFEKYYRLLKSRDVDEILCSDLLFPKDSFELQNLRLTLILGTFPESPFKKHVKMLQNDINRISQAPNRLAGFKVESLIKDLTILSKLLLNPSPDNFKKYEERIKTNEQATTNREISGNLLTSGTIALLAGAAALITFTPIPVVGVLGLITVGFFGGNSLAYLEQQAAKARGEYLKELKIVRNGINRSKEIKIDTILEELTQILTENKKGTNCQGSQTIMYAFQRIKYSKNLNTLCNTLAEIFYSFNETDMNTANRIKNIRKELKTNISDLNLLADSGIVNLDSLPALLNGIINWANDKLGYVEDILCIRKFDEQLTQQKNQLVGVIEFIGKIKIAIVSLILRKTANSPRDKILHNFILAINQQSDKEKLITALDDAILALFENSSKSKIAQDFLDIRLFDNSQENTIQNLELPVVESTLSFK
ncbi:MAG: hypothetical protein H0U73_00550 [Tatlockia sp.]|nr:hypothetical protein [Tatlockia sp.]